MIVIPGMSATASSFVSQLVPYPLYSRLYLATVKKNMVRDASMVDMLVDE